MIFAQSISLGAYAIGFSFEDDDTSIHTTHVELQTDTKSCDEIMECDNNCYDCCHCITLLQSYFKNSCNLQTLNDSFYISSLNNLPTFLYKPPCQSP